MREREREIVMMILRSFLIGRRFDGRSNRRSAKIERALVAFLASSSSYAVFIYLFIIHCVASID